MATMATRWVVSGGLAHDGEWYSDGRIFTSENEELVAQLVNQGVLVSETRYQQIALAWSFGGSQDVEAVLQKLRGEAASHRQSAAKLEEEMAAPQGRMQREGHYNNALIQQQLRSERNGHLLAAQKLEMQIEEIELAGQEA